MTAFAYYNEIDPFCAEWLRNLMNAGLIAQGVVDTRSIEDVTPDEIREFKQCHWFAGIGVWSFALRRAGWDDSRPVWTASCPCQPFSAAGARTGFEDPRHLWPSLYWIAGECRPAVLFGEQVSNKGVEPWIDLVQTDLETLGYAFGAIPFPAASVGAPHIRDRLYWMADAGDDGLQGRLSRGTDPQRQAIDRSTRRLRAVGDLADPVRGGWAARGAESGDRSAPGSGPAGGLADADSRQCETPAGTVCAGRPAPGNSGGARRLADADGGDAGAERQQRSREHGFESQDGRPCDLLGSTGAPDSFWAAADWLKCRDGKWRPVEPGTFPLADGAPARMGRLRAYGNAINAEAARHFIACAMTLLNDSEARRYA
jgi:DNA (cytosine-5)-methyltransferase 1